MDVSIDDSTTGEIKLPPRFTANRDRERKEYLNALRWSVIGHVALAVLVVIKSLVFPGKPMLYIPSLRVDIVGLPDMLKKDLKNPANALSPEIAEALKKAEQDAKKIKTIKPPVKAKAEPAEKDEMVLKPKPTAPAAREKRLKSALARIKALSKISDDVNKKSEAQPQLLKGNKISKGTSVSGDARESAEASYLDQLRDRLQENWELPVWIARQKLAAQVQLQIDSRGIVRHFAFVKSSGNAQFDEAVKKTISDSQPFPSPPAELRDNLVTDGILVGFPL